MHPKHAVTAVLAGLLILQACAADTPADPMQPYRAKGVPVFSMTPVFDELVVFPLPAGFVTKHEATVGPTYIREQVPAAESVDQWSQMITLMGHQGMAAGHPALTPQQYLAGVADGFRKACPETFSGQGLGTTQLSGHDVVMGWVSCGTIRFAGKTHSESALIIAVRGTADYYAIHWAERRPASARRVAFDEATWKDRIARLSPIRFCPVVPGERPPYPSCADGKQP